MKSKNLAALFLLTRRFIYVKYFKHIWVVFCPVAVIVKWESALMAVRDQSSRGSMGHIEIGCRGHRGRETDTEERKSRRAKTNAYRLSAFVSAAPSLTVTTLSDTHRGWEVSRVRTETSVGVWAAVNFPAEEQKQQDRFSACPTKSQEVNPATHQDAKRLFVAQDNNFYIMML